MSGDVDIQDQAYSSTEAPYTCSVNNDQRYESTLFCGLRFARRGQIAFSRRPGAALLICHHRTLDLYSRKGSQAPTQCDSPITLADPQPI